MKEKNYIITKTPNGILVKRYFNEIQKNGYTRVEFYYAKRLNFFDKGLYVVNGKLKNFKNDSKVKLKQCIACVTLVGVILAGGVIAFSKDNTNSNNIKSSNNYSNVEINKQNLPPEANIYKNQSGQEFITLDSALEISRYNYAEVKKELEEYNKRVESASKYNFKPQLFDYTTFVGVQIRESSLKINDPTDGDCKGCFKIGKDAIKEANEVAINLTGQTIINCENDLNDPIKSNKACMYIYIKNYEYVYDNINNKKLNVKIKPEMIIDEYLFGCGNINKEINGAGYTQKQYSKSILEYQNILEPYGKRLFENGLINCEHSQEYSAVYSKLNAVTENKQVQK